jgi:hypothetical protein
METQEHRASYRLFLAAMRAGMVHIAFALTALVAIAFGQSYSLSLGLIVLAVGTIAVLIDFRQRDYRASIAALLVSILLVAIDVA